MLSKPSILNIPLANGPGLSKPGCSYYGVGCGSFTSSCVDGYTAPPPPKDDSCSWTLGIGIGGVVVGAGGIAITIT